MLVCFTSDLHGDRTLYGQLDELLRTAAPELLILGGDLLRDIDPDVPVNPQLVHYEREFLERIAAWRQAVPKLVVACIPGNHEIACTLELMRRATAAGQLVLLDYRQPWQFGGLSWLGYWCAPPSPHWAKDFERTDLPGDPIPHFDGVTWNPAEGRMRPVDLATHFGGATIADELEQAVVPQSPWVLVAHAPPHDTYLDRLPHIPHPIGSRAIRRFIETRRPQLALHGHVHESPEVTGHYTAQVGATLCVNPGQGHARLQAVLFELERPAETMRHTTFR